MSGVIQDFEPPKWARDLSFLPKRRVILAMSNTPIHPWTLPGVPAEFTVSVKRDDLTGCTLTGNKIRKLEFQLADAMDRGCCHVITCGPESSNHCRATALACRQLGLKPHLIVRSDTKDVKDARCEGNMVLNRLCGAHIYLVPKNQSPSSLNLKMDFLAKHIESSLGEKSYQIEVGGSNKMGLFGFIVAFDELIHQGVLEDFDDLVFPAGSGGTAAGMAIVNYLTGEKLRLHAIVTKNGADFAYRHADEMLGEVGLGHLQSRDLLRVVEGYEGEGPGIYTQAEIDFIQEVATSTGLVLDPVYSAKAAMGLVQELQNNAQAFKGRRVLFFHTGGLFELFRGNVPPYLIHQQQESPTIKLWHKLDEFPG